MEKSSKSLLTTALVCLLVIVCFTCFRIDTSRYGEDVEIKQDGYFYYFKTKEGKMYRSHIDNPTAAEVLFKFDNMTEWKVKNGDVLVAAGDMVYFYNEEEGLRPIAKNSELVYNNKNIIDFWKQFETTSFFMHII